MVYKQAWSIKNYRYIWDVSRGALHPLSPDGETDANRLKPPRSSSRNEPDHHALHRDQEPWLNRWARGGRGEEREYCTSRGRQQEAQPSFDLPPSPPPPATTTGQEGGATHRAATPTLPCHHGRSRMDKQQRTKPPRPAPTALIGGARSPPATHRAPRDERGDSPHGRSSDAAQEHRQGCALQLRIHSRRSSPLPSLPQPARGESTSDEQGLDPRRVQIRADLIGRRGVEVIGDKDDNGELQTQLVGQIREPRQPPCGTRPNSGRSQKKNTLA
jgi:hypothetical protein